MGRILINNVAGGLTRRRIQPFSTVDSFPTVAYICRRCNTRCHLPNVKRNQDIVFGRDLAQLEVLRVTLLTINFFDFSLNGLNSSVKSFMNESRCGWFSNCWISLFTFSLRLKSFLGLWNETYLEFWNQHYRDEFTQMQCIGAIWNLQEKDCSSIKHDPTQLLFPTLYLRYAFRKWWTWRLEKINTAKFSHLQGYRESYGHDLISYRFYSSKNAFQWRTL